MNTVATAPDGRANPATRDAIEALYATGHWLYSQRRYKDSSSVFRIMLICVPADDRGWLALGACHEELGEVEVALELYGAGRVVARPSARCEVARARVLRGLGLGDDADDALARAREIAEAADDDALRDLVEAERRTP